MNKCTFRYYNLGSAAPCLREHGHSGPHIWGEFEPLPQGIQPEERQPTGMNITIQIPKDRNEMRAPSLEFQRRLAMLWIDLQIKNAHLRPDAEYRVNLYDPCPRYGEDDVQTGTYFFNVLTKNYEMLGDYALVEAGLVLDLPDGSTTIVIHDRHLPEDLRWKGE